MRALCLDFERRTLREMDVAPPPTPGPGEVMLSIGEIGVCGTDRELSHFRFGEPPAGESYLILGHEALAEVTAVGPGVATLHKGDFVVPMLRRPCPAACPNCAARRRDLCGTGLYRERGIQYAHGYFTEFAVDPVDELHLVPRDLLDVAVLTEPLSVVEKAIETALRCHPATPRTALITGAGPIGLLTALALQVRGLAPTVLSLEPEDHPRARLLRRAGIPYVRAQTPPRADLVFEASGSGPAALAAIDALAPHGVLVLIGAPVNDLAIPSRRTIIENLTFAGIVNAAPAHFQAALTDLARIPRSHLAALIERRSFDAWPASLSSVAIAPKIVHRLD